MYITFPASGVGSSRKMAHFCAPTARMYLWCNAMVLLLHLSKHVPTCFTRPTYLSIGCQRRRRRRPRKKPTTMMKSPVCKRKVYTKQPTAAWIAQQSVVGWLSSRESVFIFLTEREFWSFRGYSGIRRTQSLLFVEKGKKTRGFLFSIHFQQFRSN